MLVVFFGLSIGSFLNVVVYRTRARQSLSGRSQCPTCKSQLKWYELIPLASFLFLKRRCATCRANISWQYPLVEVGVALAFLSLAWRYALPITGFSVALSRDWLIAAILAQIFVYDLLYGEILNGPTLYAGFFLFFLSFFFGWQTLMAMLLGVAVGAGFFLFQYLISRGRWIGGGDVRLGVFMGVVLGWPRVLVAIFLAYVSGAIINIGFLAWRRRQFSDETPFGTYLAAATFFTMFFGDKIIGWYLGLFAVL
ncbi:MAG: prepilin peptidase [Candidatus Magasanikbacteria bacterium]|nr:prepilin peptidase [Candidatus Magasanikbacteria bacterium]